MEYPQIYIPNINSRRASRLRRFYKDLDQERIYDGTVVISIGRDNESALMCQRKRRVIHGTLIRRISIPLLIKHLSDLEDRNIVRSFDLITDNKGNRISLNANQLNPLVEALERARTFHGPDERYTEYITV